MIIQTSRYAVDTERATDSAGKDHGIIYKVMDTKTNTAMAACWVEKTAHLIVEGLNRMDYCSIPASIKP